jgi:hypothetical protein
VFEKWSEPRTGAAAKPQSGHPWPAALASVQSAKPQSGHPWPAALASVQSAKRAEKVLDGLFQHPARHGQAPIYGTISWSCTEPPP